MIKPVKFFLSFFVLLIVFSAFAPRLLFAASDFKTSYQTQYLANENGEVEVTQNVTIENLTSQYFVSQYKFTVGSDDIKNIKAWDPTGSLTPQIKRADEETTITLKFRARVVGKGRKLRFGISYDFPDFAKKNGLVWELNLLKVSGLGNIANYNLTVSAPESFGSLLYSFPKPETQSSSGGRTIITFKKSGLLEGAPRLAFGELQLYNLSLSYHLKNPSIGLGYTEIALPPDILGYQKIVQNNLSPSPDSLRIDEDGNYLARYNLGPLGNVDVVWEGLLALYYPSRDFGSKKAQAIPENLTQTYTSEQKYWETNAVEIKAQAAKLTDPKDSVSDNLKSIYNYVTKNLSYSYQKLETGEFERLGALETLSHKEDAVCMEYTDLFIALARSAGIPAREVNGYAYTSDETDRPLSLRIEGGDVLHAWPQAYVPGNGWTMIDPTWGSTSGSSYFSTFDLSHLAFAIKGESSEYPLPAGSYKTDPNQKDVIVALAENTDVLKENPNLEMTAEFAPYVISPFQTKTTIKVKNTGKTTAFNVKISLESSLLFLEEEDFEVGTIPPGGEKEITVTLKPQNATTHGEEKLTADITAEDFDGESLNFSGQGTKIVRPIYLPLGLPELAVIVAASASIVFGRQLLMKRLNK